MGLGPVPKIQAWQPPTDKSMEQLFAARHSWRLPAWSRRGLSPTRHIWLDARRRKGFEGLGPGAEPDGHSDMSRSRPKDKMATHAHIAAECKQIQQTKIRIGDKTKTREEQP